MATKYAEFPVEETDKFIYGVAPAQGPAQAPAPALVQTQPAGPVAPPTPVAKAPNASGLVKKVAEANKELQEQMPAPQPQSAASNLVGDITKNWENLLPLAVVPLIGAASWLATKAFGGESESGGKAKEPPKSIADRTIRKFDPLMDVNQKPPTGPVEPEFAKPTQPSVVNVTPKDPVEKMLLERYQAQQASKPQPAVQPAPVAPPSVQSLDKAFAASVAPPVNVETPNPYMGVGATPAAPVAPTSEAPKPAAETKKTGGRPPKQAVAPDEEKLTKGQQAMKKHLISMYGDGPEALSAYNQVKNILGYTPEYAPGKGGSLQPEEKAKILQYRKENIAGPKINLTHDMKKAMKGGGGIAALMAIPGFADAAQRGSFADMADIATSMVSLPFAGSSQIEPGTLTEKQLNAYKEAQKLGSPYRSVPPR